MLKTFPMITIKSHNFVSKVLNLLHVYIHRNRMGFISGFQKVYIFLTFFSN